MFGPWNPVISTLMRERLPTVLVHLAIYLFINWLTDWLIVTVGSWGWLFPLCCLTLAFNSANAALIIGCILLYVAHTRSVPPRLCGLLSIYNGPSQRAAVELAFCLCLVQHSADPLIEGLCEERREAAERLQSCSFKQPASDKHSGKRSFAENTVKSEEKEECSSISRRQQYISAAQLWRCASAVSKRPVCNDLEWLWTKWHHNLRSCSLSTCQCKQHFPFKSQHRLWKGCCSIHQWQEEKVKADRHCLSSILCPSNMQGQGQDQGGNS